MSHLYLLDDADESRFQVGHELTLTGSEGHHAVTVSRVRLGERVLLGNGKGTQAEAEVVSIDKASCECRVISVTQATPSTPTFVLIQALAKGDRAEQAIEAATELGVDQLIPYQAVRSVARWEGEKRDRGQARWQKIVREAAKQSLRFTVPEVAPILSVNELQGYVVGHTVILLDPDADQPLSALDRSAFAHAKEIAVVVGPEGGFDDRERDELIAAGAHARRLGDTVLRTSTAGVAALSLLNAHFGRW